MATKRCKHSVGGGVLGVELDTADTGVVTGDGELDVASVTPGGVPGVLDEPVVLTVLGAVSSNKDGVIKGLSAGGVVQDTRLVGLEASLVGLDGDSDGLKSNSGLHLGDVGGGDLLVSGDGHGGGG